MGVEILNRTYTNQFRPLDANVDWLLGNVGDWQKLSLDCKFSVNEEFTEQYTITLTEPNKIILNSGEKWKDKGFFVGLDFTLQFEVNTSGTATTNTPSLTVLSILDNEMEVLNAAGQPHQWNQTNFPQVIPAVIDSNTKIQNVKMWADVQPQGIQLDYAQIANSLAASGNIASHIDGTKTSLVMENTDTMALGSVSVFSHQLNFKSGLSLERATIKYISKQRHFYTYRIELTYMLSPFYDFITDLIDNTAPDEVSGAAALTDIYEITGFPVYNNPNITIKNDVKKTVQLGNTGWFDENFNQLPNPFTFTPVVYRNLAGTVVSQLDYANPITMTTTISGIANLTGASMFQYGFIWANPTDETEFDSSGNVISLGYKENNNPYHKNQKVSTGGQAATLGDKFPLGSIHSPFPLLRAGYSVDGASGMDASDISFIQNATDATAIDVTITFRPSTGFTTFFNDLTENERQYQLWISIGDQAEITNQSDRVSLKIDFNTMDTYVEPIGEWDGLTIDFLDHPQAYTDTPVNCGNELFLEDDLLSKVAFQIDTAVSASIAIPTSITFGVLAQRASDGFQYVLDKNTADLTQYPDPTQFNFDESRGFKLGDGNSKNWFKVDHNAAADSGTLKGVLGWYGFKVRWEDWIKRLPTPPNDFYLNTEANNGLNQDWFHYYNTSGWNIYFYVNIATQLGTYQNLKSMSINDYDSNGTITTAIRYYKDNNGVKGAQVVAGTDPISGGPLGVILEDDYVWLEIDYVSSGTPWIDQPDVDANVYATQCIEVDGGAGQKEFRQLSSVWSPESDNPMEPIPTESLTEITFMATNKLTVKTRILSSKLINANRYKISGRIGGK